MEFVVNITANIAISTHVESEMGIVTQERVFQVLYVDRTTF